ncbi:helix-turn-helix domain-containing protein [Streptomyces sp. NPDC050738]|uniref:helix-turn-helix domain-containing protein n=1 Tax=Streptomyces sp. NPDC050738 TaxID=3154744 RepID=UPI0034402A5A
MQSSRLCKVSNEKTSRRLPDHPLRIALLDLLAEVGTVTSSEAAQRLGESSGLCSFHLRQLARHGLIEEAPHTGGRARPWRLRWESEGGDALAPEAKTPAAGQLGADEDFSAVLHLTPREMAELASSLRELLAEYRSPRSRRDGAVPVAAVVRLLSLTDA